MLLTQDGVKSRGPNIVPRLFADIPLTSECDRVSLSKSSRRLSRSWLLIGRSHVRIRNADCCLARTNWRSNSERFSFPEVNSKIEEDINQYQCNK